MNKTEKLNELFKKWKKEQEQENTSKINYEENTQEQYYERY